MKKSVIALLAVLLAVAPVLAAPPAGVPAGSGGRPDFAGSGQPDFAGTAGQSSSAGGAATADAASDGRSSARGNSSTAGNFPSNANAGGNGLSHAAGPAQPGLQAIDQAFSAGEVSLIREYFTTRAHANKPDGQSAAVNTTAGTFKKGEKLSASYLAEPLPADLLAKLPNRPGLTYVRVDDKILMLAGPNDVIVDIIDAASVE